MFKATQMQACVSRLMMPAVLGHVECRYLLLLLASNTTVLACAQVLSFAGSRWKEGCHGTLGVAGCSKVGRMSLNSKSDLYNHYTIMGLSHPP